MLLYAGLLLVILFLLAAVFFLYKKLSELRSAKSSQSVRYGKLTEQFIPFSEKFPFPSEKFRFIGNPVDGVVFNEDEIVFCEFKAADSTLNQTQRRIRDLVNAKRVRWFEFRVRE